MDYDRIAILGAGSWGTALAYVLGGKGSQIHLWDRDDLLIADIRERGVNPKYLPDVVLPESITPTHLMRDALADANWIIVAVSSDGLRSVISEAADFLQPEATILSACKGLDGDTGFTTSELIAMLLGEVAYSGLVVLSGPNLASELVRGVPTASVVASDDPERARAAQALLNTDSVLRVYTHADVKGVELGGALKNVLAIGAGLSDGLGFGDNTKAALMTRGLMEMTQLGVAAGGKALTFLGLSGVGDLMATAGSRLSRNYRVGLGLAQNKSIDEILEELHQTAEGIPTSRAAQVLSQRYRVSTPVFETINDVIYHDLSPILAVEQLMARAPKDEFAF